MKVQLKTKKALILSPHTDDMELGAGGTVRKLVEAGVEVKSVVFSDCKQSVDTSTYSQDILVKECNAAANHLGVKNISILEYPVRHFPKYRQEILEEIYSIRKQFGPDLVITSWNRDMHQDHKTVGEEAIRAFMRTGTSIWMYQVPGTCPNFSPHVFVELTEGDVEKKIEMLHKYESQVVRRDYFQPPKIHAFLNFGGTFIGVDYAETFHQEKSIITDFLKSP